MAGLAVLIASSIMYYAEHGAQPEQFSSLGNAFVDEMADKDDAPPGEARCPTCGAPVAEPLELEP